MREKHPIGFFTLALIFILSIASIALWVERFQSGILLVCFGSSFFTYLLLLQEKSSFSHLLTIGVVARALLFLSMPSLSDDVYRFLWDGLLLKNELHPFANLPSYYLAQSVEGLTKPLYDQLNSPNYFTIYPPLNQGLFWLSVKFGGSWLFSANVIRLFLFAAEIASFFLLRSLLRLAGKKEHLAFWYFLNPLVVLEITGNLHFEGLVIFFVLLGIYGYMKQKNWTAASGFGLAVGTKLLPIIFLPFLFFKGIKNKKWWVAILAGLIGLATLLPLLSDPFIQGMQSSLDLYFRKFEFNASVYFIAREIGFWIYGYNNIARIGPLLSMVSLISILLVSILAVFKKWDISVALLFVLCTYLLFGIVIHPWYILPLIALGLLSGYWFPILWSGMIFLTYLGYTENGYDLPLWIVVVEYVSVFLFFIAEAVAKKWEASRKSISTTEETA